MKYIFLLDSDLRFNLFSRIADYITDMGYGDVVFLAADLATYRLCRSSGYDTTAIKRSTDIPLNDISVKDSIEIFNELLDENKANKFCSSTIFTIEKEIRGVGDTIIFGANGYHLIDLAITHLRKKNSNIYTVFSEMSNLPGKTFFDTHGSNARSSLYKYNSLFYGDISAYDEWRCEYLKLGSNKQRFRKKSKVQLLISLINRMWSKLCGYISPYEQKTIDSIKNKVFQKRTLNWDFDEISENESYVFFPMQLASDSQLKFNSDIDNIEAIEWICKNGILGNQILVVKPHPAEYDKLMTEKVLALKKKYNFKLTNNSSIDICKGAEKVFTINSTVGLEAMIIGSNVEFLGKSFYSKFTGDDLKNYIINHLVNIDFFTGNTQDMKKAFDGLMSHVFKS